MQQLDMREALVLEMGQPEPEREGESRAEEAQVRVLGAPGTCRSTLSRILRRSAQVLGGPGTFTWGPANAGARLSRDVSTLLCRSSHFGRA